MRLQEAYLESRGRARALRRLAVESFRSFALVFRGCLRLLGEPIPARDLEVARRLCGRLSLDAAVFELAAEAREADVEPETWFRTYYDRLSEIVHHIDRHVTHTEERPS
jgi:hypothetical protein